MSWLRMWLLETLGTWTEFDFDEVSVDCKGAGMAESSKGGIGVTWGL